MWFVEAVFVWSEVFELTKVRKPHILNDVCMRLTVSPIKRHRYLNITVVVNLVIIIIT